MIKHHNLRSQKGFTIVELLIVIVVIGILAALVLNTFAGVQAKARNTERQTDTKALSTQLEAFYNSDAATAGSYPQLTAFDTDAEATNIFKGIDTGTLRAPQQNAVSLVASATPSKDQYGYLTFAADGTTACTASCPKYKIYYTTENPTATVVVNSLN